MSLLPLPARLRRWLEHASLTTDAARALRSTVAFMVPLLVFHYLNRPFTGVIVSIAAQNIALTDVRGDYRLRFAVLFTMTLVMSGSVLLGAWTATNLLATVLAMGGLALLGGVWRHLSGDYGPRLAVVSALVFLIALSVPEGSQNGLQLAELTALGCLGGMVLQMVEWFTHPQHPLRHAVAESWVAVSDLFTAMRSLTNDGTPASDQKFSEHEQALRATLDHTAGVISTATARRQSPLLVHLEETRYTAARFATRVAAINTGLECLKKRPDFIGVEPTLDSALRALANTARSVALTLIMHRAEQFTALDVRLRRCDHLLRILDERLASLCANDPEVVQARQLLAEITTLLPVIRSTLAKTVDHGAARSASPLHLPELSEFSLRSLGAWINPAPQLDPVLVRYSARMAVVTMIAVALYEAYDIPRGYWIAFTAIVVLQPDFGSTRQKAGERIAGTLAGSILASGLLWIELPIWLLEILAASTAFCFAFFLKRRYGLAVFFVTLMLVLAIETTTRLTLEFTVSRILSNVAGGVMALLAAFFFWPHWERQQFPTVMAASVRANRTYLAAIAARFARGEALGGEAVKAKRGAEHANALAAASVQRMLGEPSSQQDNVVRTTALTAYNQRITRTLTVLAVLLNQRVRLNSPEITAAFQQMNAALDNLAAAIETEKPIAPDPWLPAALAALAVHVPGQSTPVQPTVADLVPNQLARIVTEIDAMSLALDPTTAHV